MYVGFPTRYFFIIDIKSKYDVINAHMSRYALNGVTMDLD